MLAPMTARGAMALLSPSARVLIAAALPSDGAEIASQLPWSDVHWPTLLSLTSFERAESQIFRLLRAAPVGAVPEDVQRAVQGIYRVAVFRAAELAAAAGVAADALRAAGIEVLWLKGAALAMQSPDDFAVRSMGDLDLLMDSAQQPAARQALRVAGWSDGVHPGTYDRHHHDAPMFWRGGLRLELHTGLFSPGHPFAPDSAAVWLGRSVERSWGARQARVLPPEWHLVHASVHWAWSHEGTVGSWQYLHDAHRISSAWPPGGEEWATVVRLAAELGGSRPVGWAVWSAARLAGLPVAVSTLEALRGRAGWSLGISEREWVLRAFHSPAASPSVRWSRFWWRQAMGGLGRANGAWPWALGRTVADDSEVPGSVGAKRTGSTLQRWRRHLARVLGS